MPRNVGETGGNCGLRVSGSRKLMLLFSVAAFNGLTKQPKTFVMIKMTIDV